MKGDICLNCRNYKEQLRGVHCPKWFNKKEFTALTTGESGEIRECTEYEAVVGAVETK